MLGRTSKIWNNRRYGQCCSDYRTWTSSGWVDYPPSLPPGKRVTNHPCSFVISYLPKHTIYDRKICKGSFPKTANFCDIPQTRLIFLHPSTHTYIYIHYHHHHHYLDTHTQTPTTFFTITTLTHISSTLFFLSFDIWISLSFTLEMFSSGTTMMFLRFLSVSFVQHQYCNQLDITGVQNTTTMPWPQKHTHNALHAMSSLLA